MKPYTVDEMFTLLLNADCPTDIIEIAYYLNSNLDRYTFAQVELFCLAIQDLKDVLMR